MWLIEMGYIVYTKAYSAQVAVKLKAEVNSETHGLSRGRMRRWSAAVKRSNG